jgi:glutamine synthetase
MPTAAESLLYTTVQTLQAQGVHSVLCTFTDLPGVPKGKLVPLSGLGAAVAKGAGFSGPSIWGTGLPRLGPRSEYMGRLLPETVRPLPYWPGVAHGVCEGWAGGQPLDTCPRQLLQRQTDRLAERGWRLWVGVEPEFFVFARDAQGRLVPADAQDKLAKPSYDLKALMRQRAFLDDLCQRLSALGFSLEQTDHEDACGQFEINYAHDHALAAADRYQLFKLTAHATAEAHGLVFSCMPKPFADQPGSGLHFHLSITKERTPPAGQEPDPPEGGRPAGGGPAQGIGAAVMADPAGALGLSATGHAVVAGLLAHADALAALCAPTVNSYKRLAVSQSASGTTWSPVWKAVGSNNRSALVRAVAGRIEWRLPDPSCNIYVALAGVIAAALDGVDRALPPVPATEVDLYQAHARGEATPERLPRDLCAALDALAADTRLTEALGPAYVAEHLAYGRAEWDSWTQQVSEWEWARYGDRF